LPGTGCAHWHSTKARGPSASKLSQLLITEIGGEGGLKASWRLFEALVFNWAIAAPDAHATTYSLLHRGRAVRLAPLYDVASGLSYGRDFHPSKVKMALKIGGYCQIGIIKTSHWERQAESMSLPVDEALDRARGLLAKVPAP
jgi:serine/threonine-protein kinase HipA